MPLGIQSDKQQCNDSAGNYSEKDAASQLLAIEVLRVLCHTLSYRKKINHNKQVEAATTHG